MSEKYAAKHRSTPTIPFTTRIVRRIRGALVFSGVAVVATGLAVSTGVLADNAPVGDSAAALSAASPAKSLSQDELDEREERASRSAEDRRPEADRGKAGALSSASGVANTKSEDLGAADPKALARALMPKYGLSSSEFDCVDNLWASRVRLGRPRRQPHVLRLRHSAGPARLQDVLRRPGLGGQPGDPDPLGPRLHPEPLRLRL